MLLKGNEHLVRKSLASSSSSSSSPTTNGGMRKGRSVGTCAHVACTFLHVLVPICVLSRYLSTKISGSELSRKFAKSALLAGSFLLSRIVTAKSTGSQEQQNYVVTSQSLKGAIKHGLFPPPTPPHHPPLQKKKLPGNFLFSSSS